mgnify:CR=1 FL=1
MGLDAMLINQGEVRNLALRFKLIGAIRLTKTFLISYRVTSRI